MAIVASRELQITLTSRNRERGEPIPMCGVLFHAAETYIARLAARRLQEIAVCDQMEQPGPEQSGLVRRGDCPRSIIAGEQLPTCSRPFRKASKENNFLAAVARGPSGVPIGLAYVDVSTGEFRATEFSCTEAEEKLRDELQLVHAREVLLPRQPGLFPQASPTRAEAASGPREGVETLLEDWAFRHDYGERMLTEQFGVKGLEGFGLTGHSQAICAAGALVHYLRETSAKTDGDSRSALLHLDAIRYYEQQDALVVDPVTVRNLELIAPIYAEDAPRGSPGGAATSLLGALDQTATSMGARLLRSLGAAAADGSRRKSRRGSTRSHRTQVAHHAARGASRENLGGIQDLEPPGQPCDPGCGHPA